MLDPFLGSGTTLMAAERVSRRCYGIEIDALYVDTAIKLWQQYTGNEAIHVASHKSFAQLEAERTATLEISIEINTKKGAAKQDQTEVNAKEHH